MAEYSADTRYKVTGEVIVTIPQDFLMDKVERVVTLKDMKAMHNGLTMLLQNSVTGYDVIRDRVEKGVLSYIRSGRQYRCEILRETIVYIIDKVGCKAQLHISIKRIDKA